MTRDELIQAIAMAAGKRAVEEFHVRAWVSEQLRKREIFEQRFARLSRQTSRRILGRRYYGSK